MDLQGIWTTLDLFERILIPSRTLDFLHEKNVKKAKKAAINKCDLSRKAVLTKLASVLVARGAVNNSSDNCKCLSDSWAIYRKQLNQVFGQFGWNFNVEKTLKIISQNWEKAAQSKSYRQAPRNSPIFGVLKTSQFTSVSKTSKKLRAPCFDKLPKL